MFESISPSVQRLHASRPSSDRSSRPLHAPLPLPPAPQDASHLTIPPSLRKFAPPTASQQTSDSREPRPKPPFPTVDKRPTRPHDTIPLQPRVSVFQAGTGTGINVCAVWCRTHKSPDDHRYQNRLPLYFCYCTNHDPTGADGGVVELSYRTEGYRPSTTMCTGLFWPGVFPLASLRSHSESPGRASEHGVPCPAYTYACRPTTEQIKQW